MSDPLAARGPRRRGGPKERALEEPAVVAEPTPEPVAVRPAPAPTPVAAPPPRETTDFEGLRAIGDMNATDVRALMEEFTGGRKSGGYRVGQRLRGRVTSIGAQNVFLDVGGKSDAAVDRLELGDVRLGDVIDAFVASTDGELRVTRTPSGGAAREMFVEAMAAKMPVNGKITAAADSGWQVLLTDGIKAFCPGSHTGAADSADANYVGQTMAFLVHDLRGRDVVLSRRALVEAEERAMASERYGSIQVNDVVEGTVSGVRDFGAFVKLPNGVEGMVHISNLVDRRVKHPSEVVKEGDTVTVRVLGVDAARRRVELSMKQTSGGSSSGGASGASAGGSSSSGGGSRGFDVFAALLKDVKVKR